MAGLRLQQKKGAKKLEIFWMIFGDDVERIFVGSKKTKVNKKKGFPLWNQRFSAVPAMALAAQAALLDPLKCSLKYIILQPPNDGKRSQNITRQWAQAPSIRGIGRTSKGVCIHSSTSVGPRPQDGFPPSVATWALGVGFIATKAGSTSSGLTDTPV